MHLEIKENTFVLYWLLCFRPYVSKARQTTRKSSNASNAVEDPITGGNGSVAGMFCDRSNIFGEILQENSKLGKYLKYKCNSEHYQVESFKYVIISFLVQRLSSKVA